MLSGRIVLNVGSLLCFSVAKVYVIRCQVTLSCFGCVSVLLSLPKREMVYGV